MEIRRADTLRGIFYPNDRSSQMHVRIRFCVYRVAVVRLRNLVFLSPGTLNAITWMADVCLRPAGLVY